MPQDRSRHHAIVIGASMSGLLAARVLADRYARVTIVERDSLPAEAGQRKGVPQGNHAHGLLARGREILEDLFPGVTATLVAKGALSGEVSGDALWHCAGGYLAPVYGGLTGILLSRPLLEGEVRARVRALPNVAILSGCDAFGLTASADWARVTGLRVQRTNGVVEEIAAELVVDASGNGSRTPAWLEAFGYAPPEENEVRVGLGYASRIYRRRPEHLGGKIGLVIATQPPNPRSGALLAMEGDRWILSTVGYFDRHPPTDGDGFVEFLAGLPCPGLHELARTAEPLSEVKTYKVPGSTRRHYERLKRFPAGLLVIGDAVSRFNPVFGQGMTSAALQAVALADCLGDDGGAPLWRRFFARVVRVVDGPWQIAAGADLGFAEVEGKRGPMVKFINWYIAKLHRAAHRDPAAALAFHKVANLVAPPPSILAPAVAWRVLRGNLGRGTEARAKAPRLAGAPNAGA